LKKQKTIKEKVEKIIKENSIDDAIIKLNGYLKQFHWNQYLRTRLGNLYMQQKNYVQAGKLLYLKKNKTEEESKCVGQFSYSCGRKRLQIFREIKGNNSKPPSGIDDETNQEIFKLILKIAQQEGSLPIDVVQWICYYERYRIWEGRDKYKFTEELKNKVTQNLQWLAKQENKNIKIEDKISTNKNNYDRHFTRLNSYEFILNKFRIRISGAMGMVEGDNIIFEFKTDSIQQIERNDNQLIMELQMDLNTTRLIKITID